MVELVQRNQSGFVEQGQPVLEVFPGEASNFEVLGDGEEGGYVPLADIDLATVHEVEDGSHIGVTLDPVHENHRLGVGGGPLQHSLGGATQVFKNTYVNLLRRGYAIEHSIAIDHLLVVFSPLSIILL